ncbi:hypothetical protein NP493_1407g00032 [Ridgeia piscesae]|uniref:Threonine synthase n=1 Tax=Ridgeia piscesae TaxID=27915 RepID=A0AAD9K4A6_RIDPI|nr:hypothetical protein NP493_1407g00032 [Ridgeia piscesae]
MRDGESEWGGRGGGGAGCLAHDMGLSVHIVCAVNSNDVVARFIRTGQYALADRVHPSLAPAMDVQVEVVVPTGGCGNTVAGCLAHDMGLSVHIVCAVNSNDVVARFIRTGQYALADRVHPSLAPAMDVQIPYNIERLVYLFSARDTGLAKADLQATRCATVSLDLLKKIQTVLGSYIADDNDIREAMRQCWHDNGYLVCPHTATGAHYHFGQTDSNLQRVCLATASPAKFTEAVLSAGLTPQPTQAIERLQHLAPKYQDVEQTDDWDAILRRAITDISQHHLQATM